jgi:hypothetical protein
MEVGPAVFFSLLVIAVAFMPVFTLVDQEGRLFRPLAYSKNLAMAIAAVLAITLDPAMRMLFARIDPFTFRPAVPRQAGDDAAGRPYHSEEKHPISRLLHRLYERPCRFVLRHPKAVLAAVAAGGAARVPIYLTLGSEFMPPLNEGTVLYMPSAVPPGMSVAEAQNAAPAPGQDPDDVPRGERVFGKAGRANTSTDPAPFTMMETTVILKPREPVARQAALVLVVGAGLAQAGAAPVLARPHQRGRARGSRWTRACSCPASPTPGPCRSRPPRHAVDRHPHAGRHQGARRRPDHHRAPGRQGGRGAVAQGPRHPQRVRRARRRRLLPRLRAQARAARALRAVGRRRQHDGDDRGRRRQPVASPSRAASATASTSATPATTATTSRRCAGCCCRCPRGRGRSRWRRSPTSC